MSNTLCDVLGHEYIKYGRSNYFCKLCMRDISIRAWDGFTVHDVDRHIRENGITGEVFLVCDAAGRLFEAESEVLVNYHSYVLGLLDPETFSELTGHPPSVFYKLCDGLGHNADYSIVSILDEVCERTKVAELLIEMQGESYFITKDSEEFVTMYGDKALYVYVYH